MPEYIMPDKDAPEFEALDRFTQGYIEAALWLWPEDEPITAPGFYELATETIETMREECQRFQSLAAPLLYGLDLYQCGIDFWLTRNGHGAGFWDRGLGQVGEKLAEACGWRTGFPEVYLYAGDDGLIYQA